MGFLIPGSLVRVQPGVLVDWRARMPAPEHEPEVRKRRPARTAGGAESRRPLFRGTMDGEGEGRCGAWR